jgi:molybdopterin converting factor subunit 1
MVSPPLPALHLRPRRPCAIPAPMDVSVKLFAALRESAGRRTVQVVLPDDSTVSSLLEALRHAEPRLVGRLEHCLVAVNLEYVGPDFRVRPGDDVAIIPPVSGGQDQPDVIRIVDEPISADHLAELVRTDADGAVCTFLGVARRWTRGQEVIHLEYEAYPEMAERKMREIADELRVKWGVTGVAILHRTGVLAIGEASVGIAVSSPHRREAFAACQYAIDRLKQVVPIWKKEVWSNGEQWIGWEGAPPQVGRA